ncbi:ATP-grasp domain-containing protein [Caldimonas tepidiphila]|uniref:ATP-grasp domain-containing protein n=1 Tax=Caldimonas tepidiphila TaxID=2315841 RepID=UPI000E5B7AFF|nr:ATP-grasp domain-containing protein [Caldimonas tepidiphila]
MKRTILVYEHLSAGGDGADPQLRDEGAAMRDAIVAGLAACPDVLVCLAEPATAGAPVAGTAAPRAGESMPDFVGREARRYDRVWVVAPETDGLLAEFCLRVDPARWIGCDAAAVQLATSKRATLAHLARHGLNTPLDFERAADVTRWVVKPDDGAGAVDTRVHASFDAALAAASQRRDAGRPVSLEPWVPGEALSLSLLCGGGRPVELLSVNRQRIVVDPWGSVSLVGLDLDAIAPASPRGRELGRVAAQVARAMPGLRGFVGIDLVWHARRGPVVIEVNPRVTSAFVGLSQQLGRPLAAEILARCCPGEASDAAA